MAEKLPSLGTLLSSVVLASMYAVVWRAKIAEEWWPFVSVPLVWCSPREDARLCNLIHPWVVCYGLLRPGIEKCFSC